MSKITVTTIAGQTSGADADKVKIESGDTLEVTSNATVGGTLGVTGATTTTGGVTIPASTTVGLNFGSGTNLAQLAMQSAVLNRVALRTTHTSTGDNNPFIIYQPSNSGVQNDALVINTGGQINMSKQPVFMATSDNTISLGTSFAEITAFSNAQVNVGTHYNTSNGRFTAPVAGTYQFAVASIGNSNADVYRFRFYKNGSSLHNYELRIHTEGGAFGTNGEMNITTTLAASDYISIFGMSDAGNDAYASSGYRYTYFRGHLMG